MKPCLEVLVIHASAWCRCADALVDVLGDHGALVDVDVGQGVDGLGRVGDVLLDGHAQLAGVRVDDLHALAEVGEADAAGLEDDVVLGVAAGEHDLARGRADRLLDDVAGDADDAPGVDRRRRPRRRSRGPPRPRRTRRCARGPRASRDGCRRGRRRSVPGTPRRPGERVPHGHSVSRAHLPLSPQGQLSCRRSSQTVGELSPLVVCQPGAALARERRAPPGRRRRPRRSPCGPPRSTARTAAASRSRGT